MVLGLSQSGVVDAAVARESKGVDSVPRAAPCWLGQAPPSQA